MRSEARQNALTLIILLTNTALSQQVRIARATLGSCCRYACRAGPALKQRLFSVVYWPRRRLIKVIVHNAWNNNGDPCVSLVTAFISRHNSQGFACSTRGHFPAVLAIFIYSEAANIVEAIIF